MKIVIIRYGSSQGIPSGAINFSELINTSGMVTSDCNYREQNNKFIIIDVDYSLLRKNTENVNDTCSLLYSSGTTGVSQFHINEH